jgi:S-formylglutathione hydrolase FrmB
MRKRWGRRAGILAVPVVLVALRAAPALADEAIPVLAEPPVACAGPASCVVDVDVPVPDGALVPGDDTRPGNRVRIVLPPGYDADAAERHPLLLLLHGAGDGSETWTENTDVETLVAELCTGGRDRCPVVLMPDGGGKHSETGWYTDWYDGSRQWETFHIAGVLPWAREHLAVGGCRQSTMVAGLSMGGFGSFSYAGRHPDLFVAAASFSGFLDTRPAPPLSTAGYQLAQDNGLGAPTEAMFGPAGLPTEQDGWAEHNPADLARAGAYAAYGGNLWLATGTGTPGGPAGDEPANAGSYAVEEFIFDLNQSFRVAMAQAGSSFHDQSYLGGNHSWPYWQLALRSALPEMLGVTAACASQHGTTDPDDGNGAAAAPVSAPAQTPPDGPGTSLPATGLAVPGALAAALASLSLALRAARAPSKT